MKNIVTTTKVDCHITVNMEEMAPILYNMLRNRGLLKDDGNKEPHPNFQMVSPLVHRLIQDTANEFVERMNVLVELKT